MCVIWIDDCSFTMTTFFFFNILFVHFIFRVYIHGNPTKAFSVLSQTAYFSSNLVCRAAPNPNLGVGLGDCPPRNDGLKVFWFEASWLRLVEEMTRAILGRLLTFFNIFHVFLVSTSFMIFSVSFEIVRFQPLYQALLTGDGLRCVTWYWIVKIDLPLIFVSVSVLSRVCICIWLALTKSYMFLAQCPSPSLSNSYKSQYQRVSSFFETISVSFWDDVF